MSKIIKFANLLMQITAFAYIRICIWHTCGVADTGHFGYSTKPIAGTMNTSLNITSEIGAVSRTMAREAIKIS